MNFFETNNPVYLHNFFLNCIVVSLETIDFVKFLFAINDRKVTFVKSIFPFCKFKVRTVE